MAERKLTDEEVEGVFAAAALAWNAPTPEETFAKEVSETAIELLRRAATTKSLTERRCYQFAYRALNRHLIDLGYWPESTA